MDPNLLPPELRGKEEKEQAKVKSQPHRFVVELQQPVKPNLTQSQHRIRQGSGWLKNMFGAPTVTTSKPSTFTPNTNILPSRPVEIKEELRPAPVLTPAVAKPLAQTVPPAKIMPMAVKPAESTDSWWAILANLFCFRARKKEDWRLAQADKAIAPSATPSARPELKKAELVRPQPAVSPKPIKTEEKPGSFHLAPKFKPFGFNVNLIPQELLGETTGRFGGEIAAIVLTVVICVLVVGAGYGTLFFLERDIEKTLIDRQAELDGLTKQIGDYIVREKENNSLADRVAAIKNILDEKIFWSKFFGLLEKYTLDGIYFTNLTADTSGTLTLPGVADNYHLLSQELAVLRDASEFVKDARVTNAQLYSADKIGVLGVSFQLRLVLNDQVFKQIK